MALVLIQVSMMSGLVTIRTVDKNINKAISIVVIKVPYNLIVILITRMRVSLILVISVLKYMAKIYQLVYCHADGISDGILG